MKKNIAVGIAILLLVIIILPSCTNENSVSENEVTNELSSVLSDENISNSDKSEIIDKMADAEIIRAKKYNEIIKEEYSERKNDYALLFENFSFDSAYQTLDEYCVYLENEFNNNIDFFKDFATVKYQNGTYAAVWLAEKEYECAKDYADKMQALYEELK